MEDTTTINFRRMQYFHAGFALIEAVIELSVAGSRAISEAFTAIARAQRRAQARRELLHLSNHMLRDIGIERDQIDRLFK